MQWALRNTGQAVPDESGGTVSGTTDVDIDAPDAWDVSTGDGNVVVAVIDTGVDTGHPDLAPNMWSNTGETAGNGVDDDGNGYIDDTGGWDFVDGDNNTRDLNGHGTHIAGVIAARGNDGSSVAGLNWDVSLMALRGMDINGVTTTADVIAAINYAVANGAKVINASYGSATFDNAERDAISNAASNGVLFVAPSCNNSQNNDINPCYPASYDLDNIIAVAASDQNDNLAGFSNRGVQAVDLAAPGVNIASTYQQFSTVWEDTLDFNNGWVFGGTPPDTWAIASGVLDDSPGGNYAMNSDNWAVSPAIDLSGQSRCRLNAIFTAIHLGDGDTLRFEGSTDLSGWSELGRVLPSGAGTLDILADASQFDGANPFYLRLRLSADNAVQDAGVTVDSIKVECFDQYSFAYLNGTSVAAPFVSGVAALLLAQSSSLTVTQLRDRILDNVDTVSGLSGLVATGGRLNAAQSLGATSSGTQPSNNSGGAVGLGWMSVLALVYLIKLIAGASFLTRSTLRWPHRHDASRLESRSYRRQIICRSAIPGAIPEPDVTHSV
jgi:subtilisin family serine protease